MGVFSRHPPRPSLRRRCGLQDPRWSLLGAAIYATATHWMGWTISWTTARDTGFPEGPRYVILRFVRATVAAVKAETEIEREITQDGDIAAIEKKLRQ